MESYQRLSAGIGLCTLAFGLLLLAVPALGTVGPLSSLQDQLSGERTGGIFLVAGALIGGYLAVGLRGQTSGGEQSADSRRFDRATSRPPESSTVDGVVGTAREFDTAIKYGGPAYQAVRRQLRETVLAVYTDEREVSEEVARRAVTRGEWCRDPVANAFLSGPEGPTPSRTDQVWLFVTPKQERRRRIERTITAIEQIQQG